MNYIVLDLEWNQPFSMKSMVKKPVMLRGEIIQIGAVKLDENYHILDTFKIMVAPKYYRRMNDKVTKITGIKTEDLQYGFSFPVAFKHFKKWCGEDFAFLTWGTEDARMLSNNMRLHKLDTAWIPNTYNIQVIFDDQITKEKRQVSLTYAMDKVGEPALEAHDALHDARNTVCICMHLDMINGLARYSELKKRLYGGGESQVERSEHIKTYATKDEALADPELTQFYCPKCGGTVTCIDIVKQNSSKSIAIGKCENGDELFVRFKFTRRADGSLSASRILYELDEDSRDYYMEKKQQAEEMAEAYLRYLSSAG